jgi:ABC-type branched-subunit amino acid transport system ATPase component
MAALLAVNAISKSYGGVSALDGCTLKFDDGAITGLIGPNGAGKTTLLNVISGFAKPDAGSIAFRGKDTTGAQPHALARLGVVRTFQIVRELGSLTVLENLLLSGARQTGETLTGALFRSQAVREEERANAEQARALLRRFNLWHLSDEPAVALSGGQKKLLELARALLLKPRLILLDEPAAGVSPPLLATIIGLIKELRDDGISFGIVEHDLHVVAELCDEVHVLAQGSTLVSGDFDHVISDARVIDAYLGVQ